MNCYICTCIAQSSQLIGCLTTLISIPISSAKSLKCGYLSSWLAEIIDISVLANKFISNIVT